MKHLHRISAVLVAAGLSVCVATATPATAQAALVKHAKITFVNRSDQTLTFDKANSRIYSRLGGLDIFNTASYAAQPAQLVKPGTVVDVDVRGVASEGVMAELLYRSETNATQTVLFRAHLHSPPHLSSIGATAAGEPALVVDGGLKTEATTQTIAQTFCLYNTGTKVTRTCDRTP